jgi:hypothetical protein
LEKIRILIEKGLSRKNKVKTLEKINLLAIKARKESINELCSHYIDYMIKCSNGSLAYGKSIKAISNNINLAIMSNYSESTVKTY